jgi:formylglycine-generating enzyme required for sulfatase activity
MRFLRLTHASRRRLTVGVFALTALGCQREVTEDGTKKSAVATPSNSERAVSTPPANSASTAAEPPRMTHPARERVAIPASSQRVTKESYPGVALPEQIVQVDAFTIDRREVSVRDYLACVNASVCSTPQWSGPECNFARPRREDHPVNCVSQRQAIEFCAWTMGRLPSELEWDAAALWAESKERWPDNPVCLERAETCDVDATASLVLPGWSDNIAEWVNTAFCTSSHSLCSEPVVKGRCYNETAASMTRERRLPPTTTPSPSSARRFPQEVGFRCAR